MLRKLMKIEADADARTRDKAEAASLGLSKRAYATLKSAGLLDGSAKAAEPQTPADVRPLKEPSDELRDQQFAVPDHGWIDGGGRWTNDRRGRWRVA